VRARQITDTKWVSSGKSVDYFTCGALNRAYECFCAVSGCFLGAETAIARSLVREAYRIP
jgi:hypothetical protein